MLIDPIFSGKQRVVYFWAPHDLTLAGVTQLIDLMEHWSEDNGSRICVMGEFENWKGFLNFRNLWKAAKVNSAQLENWSKFALLAPYEWIHTSGNLTDFFVPGVDLQVFHPDAKVKALRWLELNTEVRSTFKEVF